MQGINFGVVILGGETNSIPLFDEFVQILTNVWIKKVDIFSAECMGNNLSLSCVFRSITGIEKPSLNRDKSIIIFTAEN